MLGNIRRIWDDYTGAGVSAVVYDDGLQTGHGDLAGNYDASMHFKYNGKTFLPTPPTKDDGHGTSCAGLLGAVSGNGVGGVGVAYDVTLTGLNYLNDLMKSYDWDTQTTSAKYTAVMHWAAKFDIMSNSWGTTPGYAPEQSLTVPGSGGATDAGHFAWVSVHGRDGLGTVVVKAAGNETLNACGDGANVSRHSITVAATEKSGFAADYSNFGSCLLVTAPAGAVTTDLKGAGGYNKSAGSGDGDGVSDLNYTSTFNGTSAATPIVSGVVALMLDANPNLGWRDVQNILALSARHTGTAIGEGTSDTEVEGWQLMGGTQWNGGGTMFSQSYGYGMVNAYAAVRMAEAWSRMNGAADTSANERHITKNMVESSVDIADSDLDPITDEALVQFNITSDMEIDTVYITVDVSHTWAKDLEIYLVSPDGVYMTLFYQEGDGEGIEAGNPWVFAAEGFRGQSTKGTWSLAFDDATVGDTGTVWDAKLEFFGSAASVNDVYHFTDDFQMLKALQDSRGVIKDSNGGTDWLDFAAVSKTVSLSMAAGGAIKLNGTKVAKIADGADVFERLQSGDGNDALTGNGLANVIYGGRGHDKISGASGADLLHGEKGNDSLSGNRGTDKLYGEAGNDTLRGGENADQFIFARALGKDRVADWQGNTDTLVFDDAIWGGGKSVAQVLSSFADVVAGSVVFTFKGGNTVTIAGLTSISSLADDLTII